MIPTMAAAEGRSREQTLESTTEFEWAALAQYKADERFLDHYPDDVSVFARRERVQLARPASSDNRGRGEPRSRLSAP